MLTLAVILETGEHVRLTVQEDILYIKECPHCVIMLKEKTQFETRNPRQLFCSENHRHAYWFKLHP